MDLQTLLNQQFQLYSELPESEPNIAIHPLTGEWQTTNYLKNKFWWGGGATEEACQQLQRSQCQKTEFTHLGALTFGPIQDFLGGGQRLRDWAVASWLCHYLSAVFIHRWEEQGGCILLPRHINSPLVKWLKQQPIPQEQDQFWQAELPNVFTGFFCDDSDGTWFSWAQQIIQQEWQRFVQALEDNAIAYSQRLSGVGWKVIHHDHQHLWSVYAASTSIDQHRDNLANLSKSLHDTIEAQKLGRSWQKPWWGGRTSPTAGQLSIWHPGLLPVHQGGTWGLPDSTLREWWQQTSEDDDLAGLFSESERLNSIELVRRLASVPDIIEPTLQQLWEQKPPQCPWEKFPDRSAVAAAWIPFELQPPEWNRHLQSLYDKLNYGSAEKSWGMPQIDALKDIQSEYAHPRILEQRNFTNTEQLEKWKQQISEIMPQGWESAIEWSVGWRGDGDQFGEWLSGKQYQEQQLQWQRWHLSWEQIQQQKLNINPPHIPQEQSRKLDLPHLLDLSALFGYWNELLYELTENIYNSKVIYAGGDDFLLIGPITNAINLTSQLHQLWLGEPSHLSNPLDPPQDGWSHYQGKIYPIPGKKMSFSLGVVIAQRRIPQSLWHRGLNEAYKKAKDQGRDRVCVKVLFNSGQTLEWVCPWPLWHLLMEIEPTVEEKTELNRWEKLLSYLESTRLEQQESPIVVTELLDTLWASVGIPLTWQDIEKKEHQYNLGEWDQEIDNWSWWRNWIALRSFLTRQQRERIKLINHFKATREQS